MKAGDAFRFSYSRHLWVVVSDPVINPDRVLIVNMSTDRKIDQSCILQSGDHHFVRHSTCMRYDRARLVADRDLESHLSRGDIRLDDPVSSVVLDRIRQGAEVSDYIPIGCRQILVEQGMIEP